MLRKRQIAGNVEPAAAARPAQRRLVARRAFFFEGEGVFAALRDRPRLAANLFCTIALSAEVL